MPKWSKHEEINIKAEALGQTGSSTRQEICAWLISLTLPFKSEYATDSAALVCKATQMLEAAERIKQEESKGRKVRKNNPF